MTRWRDWLALNSSTVALLAAILLVTASTELWSPLIPEYLRALRTRALAGDVWILLLIGAYGFYRDALEGVNYFIGGAISAKFNTRRALLGFNLLPFVGLLILSTWDAALAVFLAIPFIFVWDSIAGPAIITVVGESVPSERRTMAFSLQAIFRRCSRVLAYLIAAPLIWNLGEITGVQTAAGVAIVFLIGAVAIQYRFMKTATRDAVPALRKPFTLLKRLDPQLKRLLAADICSRWAEGLAGPFIILFCVPILSDDPAKGAAYYASVLLTIQAVTNVVLYVLIGPLASQRGLAKKPYIGLTFVFFALFPVALIVLGPTLGAAGLALAFVVGGMREIGEPARKAMIADLVPPDARTQAIGLYWSARSVSVMLASPVGALLWIAGDAWRPGTGPTFAFLLAGLIGLAGAAFFYVRFGRGSNATGK